MWQHRQRRQLRQTQQRQPVSIPAAPAGCHAQQPPSPDQGSLLRHRRLCRRQLLLTGRRHVRARWCSLHALAALQRVRMEVEARARPPVCLDACFWYRQGTSRRYTLCLAPTPPHLGPVLKLPRPDGHSLPHHLRWHQTWRQRRQREPQQANKRSAVAMIGRPPRQPAPQAAQGR